MLVSFTDRASLEPTSSSKKGKKGKGKKGKSSQDASPEAPTTDVSMMKDVLKKY